MTAIVRDDPTENCITHPFELSEQVCNACGNWFCDGCLVMPWGPGKRALCITCAVGHSGVRRKAGNAPVRSAREIRRIEKDRRDARRAATRPVVVAPPKPQAHIQPAAQPAAQPHPEPSRDLHALPVRPSPERRSLLLRRLRPA